MAVSEAAEEKGGDQAAEQEVAPVTGLGPWVSFDRLRNRHAFRKVSDREGLAGRFR